MRVGEKVFFNNELYVVSHIYCNGYYEIKKSLFSIERSKIVNLSEISVHSISGVKNKNKILLTRP